jgi:CHRD domain
LEIYIMKLSSWIVATISLAALTNSAAADVWRWDWTADASQIKNGPNPDGSTPSDATGFGYVRYDSATNMMTVSYNWNNLFGELTKLHIHGPATADMSIPQHVVETFNPPKPIPPEVGLHTGSYTETFELTTLVQTGFPDLSPAEILQIMQDGMAYVNIHTSVYGTGEIRGNLGEPVLVPEPAAAALALVGITALVFRRRR